VIQACGRIVRSEEDHGATYLADSSLLDLFERAGGAMPPWFADQVEAMGTPDLPAFDPEAALSGIGESPERGDTAAGTDITLPGDDQTTEQAQSRNDGSGKRENEDHPLYDVWGG
jgi:hypothetical protein